LARRHPQEIVAVVDAMGTGLRERLTRWQVLDRLSVAGVPGFEALVAGLG